ncbi:MAG: NAD-dependent epimerase/dehydratase family protein [Candidatus Lokiarchaeota archaeon]|nr:NAD-dependent epimerase/dehydratase family protein [Candidatus Lokiarchaeota archaeon]
MDDDISEINNRLKKDNISYKNKTILVTGGAGFLGSWVCDVLLSQGANVLCLDDFSSGLRENIQDFEDNPNFRFIMHDISLPIYFGKIHPHYASIPEITSIDIVMHMASRASPFEFRNSPISILKSNTFGTFNALGIANNHNATFFYSSTSEVYGNPPPEAVPTPETYYGYVNPIGPRSCYDEAKRCGEAYIMAYILEYNIDAHLIRIFNTYGPKIRSGNLFGRVVPNFIIQALHDEDITVFGDGKQTRSFTYIVDEIEGILRDVAIPNARGVVINIGNNIETSVLELAKKIIELTGSNSKIVHKKLPKDDPSRRKPVLKRAKKILNWEPKIKLKEGLKRTIDWFKKSEN